MTSRNMRGLNVFVQEILNCSTEEIEAARVEKELVNIRSKFTSSGNSSRSRFRSLKNYDKRKYIWKLVYIHTLGYDIDFGHMEVINLLSSPDYPEKQVGYLAAGLLIGNMSDLITLLVNSIRNDLQSNNEYFQCLALCAIANIGGKQLTESIYHDVMKLMTAKNTAPNVRKKACLCMLSLYRTDNEVVNHQEFSRSAVSLLKENMGKHLGITLSLLELLLELTRTDPQPYWSLVEPVIDLVMETSVEKRIHSRYFYQGIPAPWIQVKSYEFLRNYPMPEDAHLKQKIHTILGNALSLEKAKSTKKYANNAQNAVLVECIKLIISYGNKTETKLRKRAIQHLTELTSQEDKNLRYFGLSGLTRLANYCKKENFQDTLNIIRSNYESISKLLDDADISMQKRALDLLFAICNKDILERTVHDLMSRVPNAESSIKEELILRTAVLAERFSSSPKWYLDTVLTLISVADCSVPVDLIYRVVQVITNTEKLHFRACSILYDALQNSELSENILKIGAYILEEFGYLLIEGDPHLYGNIRQCKETPERLLETLHRHFADSSSNMKAIFLHSYSKLMNLYKTQLEEAVMDIFNVCRNSRDVELQQRACEYYEMQKLLSKENLEYVFEAMPRFSNDKIPAIVRRLKVIGDIYIVDELLESKEQDVGMKLEVGNMPQEKQNELENQKKIIQASNDNTTNCEVAAVTPTAKKEVKTLTKEDFPRMKNWFVRCITSNKALLFENEIVQIGVQKTFKHAYGACLLYLGNRSSSKIEKLDIVIKSTPGANLKPDEYPRTLDVKKQGKHKIQVCCKKIFVDAPSLIIRFTCNGQEYLYQLKLPIVMTDFLEPNNMSADEFKLQWEALQSNEVARSLAVKQSSVATNLKLLLENIGFKIINKDSFVDQATVFANGVLHTDPASPKLHLCLMKIVFEKQGLCRLVVRSTEQQLSNVLCKILQQQIQMCS